MNVKKVLKFFVVLITSVMIHEFAHFVTALLSSSKIIAFAVGTAGGFVAVENPNYLSILAGPLATLSIILIFRYRILEDDNGIWQKTNAFLLVVNSLPFFYIIISMNKIEIVAYPANDLSLLLYLFPELFLITLIISAVLIVYGVNTLYKVYKR